MSRFAKRLEKSLRDPQHRSAYYAADAEAQLTSAVNAARKELGISQRELGEKLEKSQAAVSQFLNAENGITIERLVDYLMALDLAADVAIRRSRSDEPPVKVSLDIWEPSENVVIMAHKVFRQQVMKNPPTKAQFGRGATSPAMEKTVAAPSGAA